MTAPSESSSLLLKQSRQQLAATWQASGNGARPWRAWAWRSGIALALALVVGAILRWLPREATGPVLAVLTVFLSWVLFALPMSILLRLDHPHAAQLVPGHRAALRRSAVLAWAAVAVLASAIIWALLAWSGPALPLAAVLAINAALLAYVAAALRWWPLWMLMWVLPVLGVPSAVREPVRAALDLLGSGWQLQPWMGCALVVVGAAVVVASLFGHGDAAHATAFLRREQMRRMADASLTGQQAPALVHGGWPELLARPWRWLADVWLARCLAGARPERASVLVRLEIVLYGRQHGLRQAAVLAPILLLVIAGLATAALWVPHDPLKLLEGANVGLSIGLGSMALGSLMGLQGALWASRREQALLMLLPGVPRGRVLNRALAWGQLRQMLMLWLMGAVPLVAVAWATNAPFLAAIGLMVLPLAPLLWRDSSRARPPSPSTGALLYLVCLGLGAASLALLRELPSAWGPWMLALLTVTLAMGVWRWRRLSIWPVALPAGRH